MKGIDSKAWKILTADEQLALSLKYGHDKSSWQAGEIVGRAHYKYLEIEARARQFLKMLTEHIALYDEIIPDYLPIDKRVIKYFRETIQNRRSIKDSVTLINDDYFDIRQFREKLVTQEMRKLLNDPDTINRNVALLIFDFDRWNNFRILPVDIQEPSAFKRRNKNADKRNIKNLLTLHTFVVDQILKRYHRPSLIKKKDETLVYVPVFSKLIKESQSIMVVRHTELTIEQFSKLGLYAFARIERAKEFFDLVAGYNLGTKKDCKFGQKFWPAFRSSIKNAINYNSIQKRIPSRKFLESALADIDIRIAEANSEFTQANMPGKKSPKKVKI